MDEPQKRLKTQIQQSLILLFAAMTIIAMAFGATKAFATQPEDDHTVQEEAVAPSSSQLGFGLIAAAVAFGFGAIGAGIAISHVGAAAVGAVAEKPQVAGQALIFVALAEGLVVFGFITALMILGKV